jgi:threonine/homoserine/homoserine lactone efflux protein
VGGIGGLAGGVVGTYFSIKNTNGPRERAFVTKAAIICWVAVLVFLAVLFALPNPYRWLVWIPYAILLPIGIKTWNKRQFAIRQEESQNKPSEATR